MIFIWSNNNNGPLNYVGVIIFFVQFAYIILPAVPTSILLGLLLVGGAGISVVALRSSISNNRWNTIVSLLICGLSIIASICVLRYFDNNDARNNNNQKAIKSNVNTIQLGFCLTVFVLCLGWITTTQGTLLREIIFGDHHSTNRNNNNRNNKKNTIDQIIKTISTMPIEEYIPERDIHKCSISKLREMINARSNNNNKGSSVSSSSDNYFIERKELEDAVKQRRKGNNSCCIICFEEYQAGDIIRILPCNHEFHLECIDHWAFTFASTTTSRSREKPSCPLCKLPLETTEINI